MSEIKSRIVGTDCGTMFFQVAEKDENDKINIKTTRNAFVEIPDSDDMEDILKQNKWQYIKDGKHFYILGEDALKVARMFPGKVELRRPMQDGVLNKNEEKKMLVMSEFISSSLGKAPDSKSLVCICVSSPSVDGSIDSTFHKARLQSMFERNGWNVKVIEEGLAVILSERPTVVVDGVEQPYSGIGCSFGAGAVNIVLAYKGIQVIGMSFNRSGDWIDKQVAAQTDAPLSQVTSKKEKELDFDNINYDDDVIFALDAYYTEMIRFVFGKFAKKFTEVKSQFDAPLDIVCSGGTSMPNGFERKLKKVVDELELPFRIKDIRKSKNPRDSVVLGCLIAATIAHKKMGIEK